jgi:hypothetical protein
MGAPQSITVGEAEKFPEIFITFYRRDRAVGAVYDRAQILIPQRP